MTDKTKAKIELMAAKEATVPFINPQRTAKRAATPWAERCHRFEKIQDIVDRQAEDEGLWFVAEYASEHYLQVELRRLHRAIEKEVISYRKWLEER